MGEMPPIELALRGGRRVIVRTAEDADAPAILSLTRRIAEERAFTLNEPDEVSADAERTRARVAQFRDDPDRLWLVAFDENGELLGEVDCWASSPRRRGHRARVGIHLASDARGIGLGRAMMERVIEWAAAHPRIEKLVLGVFGENVRAIRLYKSLGFVEEGRRVADFKLGPGTYADDVLMALFVKDVARG